MFSFKKITAPLIAVALVTTGCQSGGGSSVITSEAIGGALGAVAGGLAGTQVGSGRGRTAAIIGGTVLGGIIGSAVAARLSPQGQQVAYQTTQKAMTAAPVNQPVRWADPVNPQVYGTVTPTTPPYYVEVDPAGYITNAQPQPQYTTAQPQYGQRPQVVASSAGIECRDYQTAVFSGGQPETLTGRMCRNGPGQPWRPVNDGFAGI